MTISPPLEALTTFFDTLIPGDAVFPRASVALAGAAPLPLDAEDRDWLAEAAAQTAAAPDPVAAVAHVEAAGGARFARVYQALMVAYYAAPSVREAAEEGASRAPVEPDPHFDESLVAGVLRERRGAARIPGGS